MYSCNISVLLLFSITFCGSIFNVNSACEEDWYEIPSHGCFQFSPASSMNWLDGNEYCQNNGGYLAEILDIEMEDTLRSLWEIVSEGLCSTVWIGGNDISSEANWWWIHSRTNVESYFWDSVWDQPNG